MMKAIGYFLFFSMIMVTAPLSPAGAVTLQELLNASRGAYNPLKEQQERTEAQNLRYKASFDAYYPSLDYSLGYGKDYHNEINPSLERHEGYSATIAVSYQLLNFKRMPAIRIEKYGLLNTQNTLRSVEKDLTKMVKDLYYAVVSQNQILQSRNEALKSATRTHELASARREVGLAKLSDVYQAKVRMENARFDVVSAENTLKKLVYELASITGLALTGSDFKDTISEQPLVLKEEELFRVAIENRDDIRIEENNIKKAEEGRKIAIADFLPTATATFSSTRPDQNFYPDQQDNRLGIVLSWNIFSGPGKFFKYSASKHDVSAQKFRLEEVKRTVRLDVQKNIQDLNTDAEKIKVSDELVKSAQETYNQTYEEYRVGKGDILNLLQAELALSSAREQKITSILNFYVAKTGLERSLGIESAEGLK